MDTIEAVFEGGVFRPLVPVTLPENTRVEFEPRLHAGDEPAAESSPTRDAVYEVLSRRFRSGHHDTAERHNEHQP